MSKNKKIIRAILILLASTFIINIIYAGQITPTTKAEIESRFTFPNGHMGEQIINPLNQISNEVTKPLKSSSKTNFKTEVTTYYKDFADYSIESSKLICQIGGNYLLNIISKPSHGTPTFVQTNLFNCKTTQDLINLIKIPSSWSNDEIIIYCNDGLDISSKKNNFDFLTSKISSYKSCIVKNINKDLTIFSGIDVGNPLIDEEPGRYFDSSSNRGSIINSKFTKISQTSNILKFKDPKDNLNYYFSYDNTNKFYSLRNFNDALDTNINTIFTTNIGISRIALHKQLNNGGGIIYGYENSISNKPNLEITNIQPVYEISYNGALNIDSNLCSNYLKKYDAISGKVFQITTPIQCIGSKILINSYQLDRTRYGKSDGKVDSFNLFKNIILGLN